MSKETQDIFLNKLNHAIKGKFTMEWETDKKGVTCGWCKLADPTHITRVAEIVAGFKGRVMTISPLVTSGDKRQEHVEINYHFYFGGVNCTVRVTLPNASRKINSITPILKSADWHEREMQELFNIKLLGHPNPNRLFLDESIRMNDNTMISLSEAMDGSSTNTLWEKIMESNSKGVKPNEQL
jgi:NADH-quinone oxidoreductase subunit C